MKSKLIRTSTVPISLNILLKGQLSFLAKHFDLIAVSSPGKDLEIIEERDKVRTHAIEIKRHISLRRDFISLIRLYQFFKKEKPLIVHSITPKAGLLSMLAAKFAGVPIRMHTFTGLIFPTRIGFMQKLLIKMDQLLCWAATNIYPEGQGVKNDLIDFKITNKPLKILANGNVNGIDIDLFNPENFTIEENRLLKIDLGINETDFVFIFVGRLVRDKGINELVEVFSELTVNYEGIKLLLVGSFESDLDPLHKNTIELINNSKNIISVGFQSDVRSYFSISDVLVFPSYREGFPNAVIQAGAMGLPAIVTDINGCNEIIVDGENGIIIPSKNKEKLKDAILQLLLDDYFRESLQKNARHMIISRYQQKIVWDAILEEYESLKNNKIFRK